MPASPLPLGRPGKIVCVGMNYRDHAEEAGLPIANHPVLFAKWPTAVIGEGEPIEIPPFVLEADYEAELGVVIGRRIRDASIENALEVVAGYVCVNDISARDLQFVDSQFSRSKSFDTFCPVGPRIVPPEEVGDPQALAIRLVLNGRLMQDSTTANMIFSVANLISFISKSVTLDPGDLIATGTPAGVGFTRQPPVFLKDGDEVTVEIERVGALTNPVRAGAARTEGAL